MKFLSHYVKQKRCRERKPEWVGFQPHSLNFCLLQGLGTKLLCNSGSQHSSCILSFQKLSYPPQPLSAGTNVCRKFYYSLFKCKYFHNGYNFCKFKITDCIFFCCYILFGVLVGTMVFL